MKKIKLLVAILVLTASSRAAFASGEVDPHFRANLANFLQGHVTALAVQPDGKTVVGGYLGLVNGVLRDSFVRLHPDGTVDTTFTAPPITSSSYRINVIAFQPDGKILVGGSFATANRRSLMRLNPDGSHDPTFSAVFPLGDSATVNDILFYPDGRILIVGSFFIRDIPPTDADRNNIVRVDANGNIDLAFEFTAGSNATAAVLLPDLKLLAATTNTIIRRYNEDGSVDNSFTTIIATSVTDLELLTDGKILVAASGSPPLRRFNADGSIDASYPDPGINVGINSLIRDSTGKFYIGGTFSQVSGITAYRKVARLNSDGTPDLAFLYSAHIFATVEDLAMTLDGKLLVGGDGLYEPNIQSPLTRVSPNGSLDTSFHVAIATGSGKGYRVLVQPDNKILIAGQYEAANGVRRRKLARFNADGSLDTGFVPPNYNGTLFDLALQPDGKIVVVNASGRTQRLHSNGSLDVTFDFDSSNRGEVEIQADGKVLVASTNLRRYNSDGSAEGNLATLTPSNSSIYDIALQADGKMIVGGTFSAINGVPRNMIARLNPNGSVDQSFVGNPNSHVIAIAIQQDGKILIAGNFTSVSGDGTKQYLARLNSDGTLDTNFSPVVNAPVLALKIQSDGRILIGGSMSHVNGVLSPRLARLFPNGTFDSTFSVGTGADSTVWSIDQQSDGKVVYAGEFTRTNGLGTFGIGRLLNAARPTLFDYDGDLRADVSVFRPSENKWYILRSSDSAIYQPIFAIAGDIPTPADFDGDGKTDVAIFRPSAGDWWYIASTDGTQRTTHWGRAGDIPRPSDFDGDGRSDFIIFRPSENNWYRYGSTGAVSIVNFGSAGDKPLTGDFDGDGRSDPAVYRPSAGAWWYLSSINGAYLAIPWGLATDIPAPADYDGDGKTDFAVYRASEGAWYIYMSATDQQTVTGFGIAEDRPVPADYDGDGRADIAVFRPSTQVWYILRSTSGFTGLQFGASTDIPTESAFIP